MCILFMYVANCAKKPSNSGNNAPPTYKLIIASNRDEKYNRATKAASFWENTDSHILAGQDLQEFGTWLGISKHGKLAVLLNVMGKTTEQPESLPPSNKTSRGSLIIGYLRSPPGLLGSTYCNSLCEDPESLDLRTAFNPFHLITIDIHGRNGNCERPETDTSTVRMTYLTNKRNSSIPTPQPECMTPQINTCEYYAIGNSMMDRPFQKVLTGRTDFKNVVEKYSGAEASETSNESLTNEILEFLRSTKKCFPDESLTEHAKGTIVPPQMLPGLSSRFISIPQVQYGTRTNTIIIVDTANNVTYHEWTMKEPIDGANPTWLHSKFQFSLSPPN
ncbi:Transport and Golgi organization protein 2 [Orchesella cincta]|uniref:Transport and Golgi organization protein 2 n=1 Tax=Orchesella cincta TaxID=48709 RepID=A0A1D2NIQ3_ORCCI|nr:Transport and Golgi organization protein 2 [Orchesella cincta]